MTNISKKLADQEPHLAHEVGEGLRQVACGRCGPLLYFKDILEASPAAETVVFWSRPHLSWILLRLLLPVTPRRTILTILFHIILANYLGAVHEEVEHILLPLAIAIAGVVLTLLVELELDEGWVRRVQRKRRLFFLLFVRFKIICSIIFDQFSVDIFIFYRVNILITRHGFCGRLTTF